MSSSSSGRVSSPFSHTCVLSADLIWPSPSCLTVHLGLQGDRLEIPGATDVALTLVEAVAQRDGNPRAMSSGYGPSPAPTAVCWQKNGSWGWSLTSLSRTCATCRWICRPGSAVWPGCAAGWWWPFCSGVPLLCHSCVLHSIRRLSSLIIHARCAVLLANTLASEFVKDQSRPVLSISGHCVWSLAVLQKHTRSIDHSSRADCRVCHDMMVSVT